MHPTVTASDSILSANKTSIEIDNVRIYPAKLIFCNVVVGKGTKEKFLIRNEGRSKALVRIPPCNVQGLKVSAIPKGVVLRPGLKLIHTVNILSIDANNLLYVIPIYINDHCVKYEAVIQLGAPNISYVPSNVDFGIIDEGVISAHRTIVLTNDGNFATTFQVDMVKTKGHIILEPNKGIVQAKSKIVLKVKLIPLYNGQLNYILVIKCYKSLVIPITATVIVPKLEAIHPIACKSFTLLYFSPTYFGLKQTQRLMIRNYSSVDCMFATDGEYNKVKVEFEELSERNPDFKEFKVSPTDGIMQPQETKLFWITFSPTFKNDRNKSFYFCTLIIQKIRCKNIENECIRSDLCVKTPETSYRGSLLSVGTLGSIVAHRSTEYEPSFLTDVEAQAYSRSQELSEKDMVRLHICGVAEIASVEVTPDELHLDNMKMQVTEIRVLELKNLSKNLPIIVCYKKIPFVYLSKSNINLKPLETKQIAVTIIPHQLGTISTKIIFELMYYDHPKEEPPKVVGTVSVKTTLEIKSVTSYPKPVINPGLAPNYINEVGKNCQDIRFNSSFENTKAITVDMKKHLNINSNDLVALPNDCRKSIRPWRSNVPCCTMFAHQPRYIQPIDKVYERTLSEQDLRKRVTSYYNKHIGVAQRRTRGRSAALEDYAVVPQGKLSITEVDCMTTSMENKHKAVTNYFLPLTPQQMRKVVTLPECVRIGAIAANYSLIFPLRIQNFNKFSLRLYIRSDNSNICCIRENRYILEPESCLVVKMVYISGNIGYYAGIIDLIFNESMMIPVPVVADVVPKILHISTTRLVFNENCTHKYIELINNLNVPIRFFWIIEHINFHVQPLDGIVEPGCTMTCVVYYFPEIEGPTQTVIKFMSGDCPNQSICITTQKFNRRLELVSNRVNFDDIPLLHCCTSYTLLKNLCNFPIALNIDRSNLKASWIKIFPMKAVIPANSQLCIIISAICPKCVTFRGIVKLIVVNADLQFNLNIKGNVVYPDVRVNPNPLNFPNTLSNTHSTIEFMVTNKCPVFTCIKFAMEEYDEFRITETSNYWDREVKQALIFNPYETMVFYIHFLPTEAISTWFYLPLIINTILGPPLRYDTITQLVDYYLGGNNDLDDNYQYIPLPQKIPCVKVSALSWEPKIAFSKTKIIFQAERMNKKKSYVLKISNPQNITEIVFIKLNNLVDPFNYFIEETPTLTKFSNGVSFKLEPDGEAEITIIYEPQSFGKCRVSLPVCLPNKNTSKMHTVIEVVGVYEEPQISLSLKYVEMVGLISEIVTNKALINTVDKFWLYSRPVPENVATYCIRDAFFKNHDRNCQFSGKFNGDVQMKIYEDGTRKWINETDYVVALKFWCPFSTNRTYTGYCEVSCSCGGIWKRPLIGVFENSFLTTYAFSHMYLKGIISKMDRLHRQSSSLILSKSTGDSEEYSLFDLWHLYPLFPTRPDEFTAYMEGCVHAIEMWVYNQGLFQEHYYTIPYCINKFYKKDDEDKNRSAGSGLPYIPYLHLLKNILGDQCITYFGTETFPSDESEQAEYMNSFYKKVLDFLKNWGGTFTYTSPEFFLPFTYFEIYMRTFNQVTPQLPIAKWIETIEEFMLLTKQSWLDLLLQTYKVLYLYRLPIEMKEDVTYIEPLAKFFNALPNIHLRNSNVHSKTEQVIMAWFQYHYNQDNIRIWKQMNLPCKLINVIGDCFIDGLVFTVVTCVYCPYLIPFLRKVYSSPETVEDYTHNLLTVIQGWEILNCSFEITVDEILKPNSLRILFLLVYLYDVLPSMYPSETIVFKAGLSLSTTKSLKLSNPNNYPIAYKPIIIPENSVFILTETILVIPPKKTIELKMVYNAKFAREFTCTLLLSGEVPKYHYARNKCLNLHGIPDLSYPSTIITHPVQIYSVHDIELTIQTPYKCAINYDLRQSARSVENYTELSNLPIHKEELRYCGGRVTIANEIFITNNEGVMIIQGILRCLFARKHSSYLYFLNQDVGDFMVRIDTKWYDNKFETLFVTLPDGFSNDRNVYDTKQKLAINMPLQSNAEWDVIKDVAYRLGDEDEKAVWRNILDIPTGRLIASRLNNLSKYMIPCGEADMELPIVYKITTDKDCNIVLPTEVTINNEYEEGIAEIEFKLKPGQRFPNNFLMTLTDTVYSKLRRYKVIFLCNHSNANIDCKFSSSSSIATQK